MQGMLGIQQAMTQQQEAQKTQQLKGLLGQRLQDGDMAGVNGILMQLDPVGAAKGMQPKPPKWQETRLKKPDGTVEVGYVDMNSPTPEATFRARGVEPVRMDNVNGAFVNPYQPPSTPIPSPTNPFNVAPDGKGGFTLVPNQPVQEFKLKQAATGASKNVTNVNMPGDNQYINARRGDQAKAFGELEKSAQSAYNQYSTLDRFIQASEKGFSGGAAPLLTGTTNLLSSFGINIAPEKLKDTRIMEQAIGDILGNKMVELGARGLTDKDMEILRQNLPRVEIDKTSRVAVANVLKKSASSTLREYENARSEEAKNFPELAARSPTPAWLQDYRKNPQRFGNAPSGPESGVIKDGYRFKGGNPADKNNWEKVNG